LAHAVTQKPTYIWNSAFGCIHGGGFFLVILYPLLPPALLFAIGIKLPFDVTVQCPA
jgi:hypothetical protein